MFTREIVCGSSEEHDAVNELKNVFRDYKADDVLLEPVNVLSWVEEECFIEAGGYRVVCKANPYTLSSDVEGSLVIGGYSGDRIVFWENPRDKVVLIPYPGDPDDAYFVVYRLSKLGVRAIVFYDELPGRYRRIVVTGVRGFPYGYGAPPLVPVVSIRKEDFLRIRKTVGRLRVYVKTRVSHNSTGYNVVAVYNGRSCEEIHVTAHHDHWFTGYSDDLLGVEVVTRLAKELSSREHRYTYYLISFTAEESGALGFSGWYWIWGSRVYLRERLLRNNIDNIVLDINIDSVFTKPLRISLNPLLYKLGLEISRETGIPVDRIEMDKPLFDSFSYTLNGILSLTLHTHQELRFNYHTNLDDGRECPQDLIDYTIHIVSQVIGIVDKKDFKELVSLSSPAYFIEKEVVLKKDRWPIELRILIKKLYELDSLANKVDTRKFIELFTKSFIKPVANYRINGCFSTYIFPKLLIANDISCILDKQCSYEAIGERMEPGIEKHLPYIPLNYVVEGVYRDQLVNGAYASLEIITYTYLRKLDQLIKESLPKGS